MAYFQQTIDVQTRGSLMSSKTIVANMQKVFIDAATGVAKEMEQIAKKVYAEKRGPSPPNRPISQSMIISSFGYDVIGVGVGEAIGVCFAGGPTAPYAPYVEYGHALRNKKGKFEGHGFMMAAFEHAKEISNTEFQNAYKKYFG